MRRRRRRASRLELEGQGLEPMVRLTIAAYPDLRILVPMRDGRRISEASGDKLTIDGVGAAPATARR